MLAASGSAVPLALEDIPLHFEMTSEGNQQGCSAESSESSEFPAFSALCTASPGKGGSWEITERWLGVGSGEALCEDASHHWLG